MTRIPENCLQDPEFCLDREDQLQELFAAWRALPISKRAAFYDQQPPDTQEALDFHCAMVARWVLADIEQMAEDYLAAEREGAVA